jgi:hypothetical protein
MPLSFWIAVGTAVAVLLIGLLLRVKRREIQVLKNVVDPPAPAKVLQFEYQRDTDELPDPRGEEMNTPTTTPTSRSLQGVDLRRSSRIERRVPLLILGTDSRGETFQEQTSAVALNLHGCRYPSRHSCVPDGWVTLQVTGTDGVNSAVIRARVRSVLSAQTPRELCQVGVELDTPGNVWGIPAPPEDWQRQPDASNSYAQTAAAVAPVPETAPLSSFLAKQSAPPERKAEVTVFPGAPAAAAAAAEVAPAKDPAPIKTERVVISSEQFLNAMQGKMQLAADRAVQGSLSTRLDEAVKIALARIEDGWKAQVCQTEQLSADRLAEVKHHLDKELADYRSRAEEISLRVQALADNSQQILAETQKFVERLANETAPQLHARLIDSFGRANSEFEARAAQVSGQHLARLAESSQIAARDARSQLNEGIAEARSLLASASGGLTQEYVESLVDSSKEQTLRRLEERLGELYGGVQQQYDLAHHRTDEIVRRLESFAGETNQVRSQHEQVLSELRAFVANANPGVTQERFDSLLSSSREQILSHLEWRLGEVLGRHEQLLGEVRDRAGELAKQVEKLSGETRDHLAEARSLADRASRGLSPEHPSAIEQSLRHAANEFESVAARVSNRELVRLMEQKRAVFQEVSLEVEARTSEGRVLLQNSANSTLEEFRRRFELQIDLILAEAKERVTASLTALDAESRTAVEARRRALETDVARAAEQSTMEFRSGIKAFLYSCLVAAVGAVDQHAQTTLAGLANDPNSLSRALDPSSGASPGPGDLPAQPNSLSASQ